MHNDTTLTATPRRAPFNLFTGFLLLATLALCARSSSSSLRQNRELRAEAAALRQLAGDSVRSPEGRDCSPHSKLVRTPLPRCFRAFPGPTPPSPTRWPSPTAAPARSSSSSLRRLRRVRGRDAARRRARRAPHAPPVVACFAIQIDAKSPADLTHTNLGVAVRGVPRSAERSWLRRIPLVPARRPSLDHEGARIRGWYGAPDEPPVGPDRARRGHARRHARPVPTSPADGQHVAEPSGRALLLSLRPITPSLTRGLLVPKHAAPSTTPAKHLPRGRMGQKQMRSGTDAGSKPHQLGELTPCRRPTARSSVLARAGRVAVVAVDVAVRNRSRAATRRGSSPCSTDGAAGPRPPSPRTSSAAPTTPILAALHDRLDTIALHLDWLQQKSETDGLRTEGAAERAPAIASQVHDTT
jgi:hypothetical protein